MNRFFPAILYCLWILCLFGNIGFCADFNEQLWENYAEIQTPAENSRDDLACFYLNPQQFGAVGKTSFADLRIVTDLKEEVPWQIIPRRRQAREEEIPHHMQNLSLNEQGDTWLELLIDKPQNGINAVDVITSNTDFTRQVQVLSSMDGLKWNTVRNDGIIFDFARRDMLRRTRITFPPAGFSRLALKIINGGGAPLTITAVKIIRENQVPEQTYSIPGTIEHTEFNAPLRENSMTVRIKTVFPIDRLTLTTAERNFRRTVEVQVRNASGQWMRWAQGTIFNFDTPASRESKLTLDLPEIAAEELRLVFRNLDSPPLAIIRVTGEGYRRLLVFRQSDRKTYLFWGNPLAWPPRYDLTGIILTDLHLDRLPVATLGPALANPKFAGNRARLPFTERYKYALYLLVMLGIAGLIFLQYRVFRRTEP